MKSQRLTLSSLAEANMVFGLLYDQVEILKASLATTQYKSLEDLKFDQAELRLANKLCDKAHAITTHMEEAVK